MPGCGRQEPFRAAIGPICAGLAVLAACSSGTRPGGTATVPSAPATTTPTTTADPWAVPATITAPYVDRVLAELNHIDGTAKRSARTAGVITSTFTLLESEIRAGKANLDLVTRDWQQNIDRQFAGIRATPGDRHTTVTKLLPAPLPCVLAAVAVDFSDVTVGEARKYPPWYVALVPTSSSADNPTHWSFADDGFEPNGGAPDPAHACSA